MRTFIFYTCVCRALAKVPPVLNEAISLRRGKEEKKQLLYAFSPELVKRAFIYTYMHIYIVDVIRERYVAENKRYEVRRRNHTELIFKNATWSLNGFKELWSTLLLLLFVVVLLLLLLLLWLCIDREILATERLPLRYTINVLGDRLSVFIYHNDN